MDSEDIDMIPTDDLAPHQDADGDDFWGNSGIKDDTDAKEPIMKKPRIEDSNTTGETPDRYSDYSGHDSLRHKKSRSHRVSLGGDCGGAPPEEVTDDPGPKIDLPAGEEERNAGADQEPGAGEQAATKTTQESKSSEVNQPKESSPANSLEASAAKEADGKNNDIPKTPGTPDASNTASNYVFGSAFAGETFSTIGYTANSPNVFNVNPGRVPNLDLNDLLKIPALEFSARDDSKTDDPDATFDEDGGSDQGDTNVRSVRNAVTSDVSEQNEFTKLKILAKFYLWDVGACEWSRRGDVSAEIAVPDNNVKNACIVIRALHSRRTLQNTRLFKEMRHKIIPPKHVTFIGTDLNSKLSKFMLKMRSESDAKLFMENIDKILAYIT